VGFEVERAKREKSISRPGYLMLSMVASASMEIGILPKDSTAGLNYGIDKVRFLARFLPAPGCDCASFLLASSRGRAGRRS
jgi:hypothetical protein